MDNLVEELRRSIHGDVAADDVTRTAYSHDYSIFEVRPEVVVFPKDVNDVKSLVRLVKARRAAGEKVSLTGRSAGTDMSGGPLTESIVVEFTKYFNHVREVACPSEASAKAGDCYAVAEPGVYYRDFEKAIAARGLMYPSYPASKDLCAIGGIVSNNSGGEKTLQYGKTEDYVSGLKMVMADGEEHEFRPLRGEALAAKLAEPGFEGDLYRKTKALIEANAEIIRRAKPDVSKNSAGYFLWNVWDGTTFDLTRLLVGSQGTLGLVTEARFRLLPQPKFNRLLVVFARSLDPVPKLVQALLPFKPESIESYDDRTLGVALKFFPALLRLMKGNIFLLALSFIPEAFMVLRGGFPKMVLLVSVTGDDEADLDRRMADIVREVRRFPVSARVTRSAAEAEKYWTIRRQSFKLLHSNVKGRDAAAFVDDIIVKPEYMPEFLPKVNAILDRYGDKLVYTIAGHPGNGNFHIIPLADLKDEETRRIIPKVTEEIYKLTLEYRGSITGEHNDGLIRTPYLELQYGPEIVRLFAAVKNVFDPDNLFNPGKKVGATKEYSFAHMKR